VSAVCVCVCALSCGKSQRHVSAIMRECAVLASEQRGVCVYPPCRIPSAFVCVQLPPSMP
jgi:hypothetical protein